jgi:hypothetical protein
MKSIPAHPFSLRSILIVFSHLYLGLNKWPSLFRFSHWNSLCIFTSHVYATWSAHFITLIIFDEYKLWISLATSDSILLKNVFYVQKFSVDIMQQGISVDKSGQTLLSRSGFKFSHLVRNKMRCCGLNSCAELLGVWTFSIVRYSTEEKTRRFGNCICFCPQVKVGEALSKGPTE